MYVTSNRVSKYRKQKPTKLTEEINKLIVTAGGFNYSLSKTENQQGYKRTKKMPSI